jgi:hypothetical protein
MKLCHPERSECAQRTSAVEGAGLVAPGTASDEPSSLDCARLLRRLAPLGMTMLLALPACRDMAEAREDPRGRAPEIEGTFAGVSDGAARYVRTIIGFGDPECVRWDAAQDVYFVSNVAGFGSKKDNNGYISRIPAATLADAGVFVQGGKDGVELHAPKGMAIQGDTLWVTDIDVVRGFDKRTGRPVGTIDFRPLGAVMLNDIAVGPNGVLRVTDTGIWMVWEGNVHSGPDRIFEVGPGHAITTVANSLWLRQPNGVTWDSTAKRWVVVSFDRFAGEVATMPAGADSTRRVIRTGPGQLDGVQVRADGALLFSSWADSSIHLLKNGRESRINRQVPEAAAIGWDEKRQRVLIPLATRGWVQVWEVE